MDEKSGRNLYFWKLNSEQLLSENFFISGSLFREIHRKRVFRSISHPSPSHRAVKMNFGTQKSVCILTYGQITHKKIFGIFGQISSILPFFIIFQPPPCKGGENFFSRFFLLENWFLVRSLGFLLPAHIYICINIIYIKPALR